MLHQVLKIGNSLGVTFPKEFVNRNKIKAGTKVQDNHSNGSITYFTNVSKPTKYETVNDREFLKVVKEVELRYRKALEELANL